MRFSPIEPNINLDLLAWGSESGRWQLGFRSVLYGIRVSLTLPYDFCYTIDYCVGTNGTNLIIVFQALRNKLLEFDESVFPSELQRCFPAQHVKPIENDSECLDTLIGMMMEAIDRFPDQIEPIDPHDICSTLQTRFNDRFARLAAFRETTKAKA